MPGFKGYTCSWWPSSQAFAFIANVALQARIYQQCMYELQCRHTSAVSSAQLCQGIQSVNCLLLFSTWQYWNASGSFPGDTCTWCKYIVNTS